MQRSVLLSLSEQDLEENFLRFQQAIEDLEYCLVTVLEEQDELHLTNQMLKEIASNLKSREESIVVYKPKAKPSQWSTVMQEILNERPSITPAAKEESLRPSVIQEEIPPQIPEPVVQPEDLASPNVEEEKNDEKKFENEDTDHLYESSGKKEISEDEETKTSECSEQIELPRHYAKNIIRDIKRPPSIRGFIDFKRPPRARKVRTQITK